MAELWRCLVKSMAGERLREVRLTPLGLETASSWSRLGARDEREMTREERRRRRYRPHHVRVLVIGESPPASGRSFYAANSAILKPRLGWIAIHRKVSRGC